MTEEDICPCCMNELEKGKCKVCDYDREAYDYD